jgi:hypothetical protein
MWERDADEWQVSFLSVIMEVRRVSLSESLGDRGLVT